MVDRIYPPDDRYLPLSVPDYSGTYGIQASGNSVSLKLKQGNNIGSRVYLINGNKYELFKLKNQEFTFDVDVSGLGKYPGCGEQRKIAS